MRRETFFVCSDCLNTFSKKYFSETNSGECPIEECDGIIIEIDKYMINTFITLNKKGYRIFECSEGDAFNFMECVINITFEEDYKFETLPQGFYMYGVRLELQNCIEDMTYIERQREYTKQYANILKWAEELPPRETLSKSA